MSRSIVLCWHVLHQRRCTTCIQEVDSDTCSATIVGRGQTSVEVGYEVDTRAIVSPVRVQDTRNCNTDIGLRVVTDDGSVNQEGQQGVLIGSIVVFEQGGCVLVTD